MAEIKLTAENRRDLLACWSPRRSADKTIRINSFLDSVDEIFRDGTEPIIPPMPLTRKEWDKELEGLLMHANAICKAFERMSVRGICQIGAVASGGINGNGFPNLEQGLRPLLADRFVFMAHTVNGILAATIRAITEMPGNTRPGPQKTIEYQLLIMIVYAYREHIGRVSSSENGVFMRFLRTLGPMTGFTFGVDLLRRVLHDFPE